MADESGTWQGTAGLVGAAAATSRTRSKPRPSSQCLATGNALYTSQVQMHTHIYTRCRFDGAAASSPAADSAAAAAPAAVPASLPVSHAHQKLNPPMRPKTSSTSPQRNRPGSTCTTHVWEYTRRPQQGQTHKTWLGTWGCCLESSAPTDLSVKGGRLHVVHELLLPIH